MCGRYSITLPPEAIRQLFQTHGELPNWPAYYNAPPTTALPVLGTTSGEGTFIGHPKADKVGKILVLATAAEVGVELDAEDCSPTGRSNPQRGREYRLRYFRQFPGVLQGNP